MNTIFDPRAVRCVVFDVDDTLYLEHDYVRSGFRAVEAAVAARFGREGFACEAQRLFDEGARGDIFDRALSALNIAPAADTVGQLVEVYRRHRPSIALLPDAEAALRAVYRYATVAIITDGPAPSQRAKIDALQLGRWADFIVVTAEYGAGFGKPHTRAFLDVERWSGASGAELVYLADNPAKDFVAPNALGWQSVRICRPGGLHEHASASAGPSGGPSGGPASGTWADLRPLMRD
jgi:putative hydrolase of the HAD superfamily